MINKQNLWFVTLFSLILVLGIYYVTLADESLQMENIIDNSVPVISFNDTDSLTALKVANDENVLEQIAMYQNVILNDYSSLNEKNDAYENLQNVQNNVAKTEEIAKLILEKFNLNAFIKIESDVISVTVSEKEHSNELANNIIIEIQKLYDTQMYITVKFS
ncbi:MAG: hypothetical protein R3Y13_02475 [bacterium]